MLKVGITGGIGSGKSTICQVFETLGISVFYADKEARHLIDTDPQLVAGIKQLFGAHIYKNGALDRTALAAIVFHDKSKLQALNALTHPAVIAHADRWIQQQLGPYILKEAALFFESDSYKQMDIMIGVSAPIAIRIKRIQARDGSTTDEVMARIAGQMNEEEKMSRCDYIIINDDLTPVIPQVIQLHQTLLGQAGKN